MTVPIESIPGLILMIMQHRHNEIFTRVTVFMNIFIVYYTYVANETSHNVICIAKQLV